jgi:hypothetical protein
LSVSVSIGGGGVGWFPLGPREVYVPARRFSNRYVERVNVSNTVIVNRTYITNVYNNRERNVTYRNRGVPGAVTAVSRSTFTSAQRVGDHRVRIDEREVSRTQGTAVAPQIAPVRESRLGAAANARVNGRAPPRTVVDRQVVVKRDPPPAARHFVRGEGTNNPARERVDRSQRSPDVRQDNRVERGRVVDGGNTREPLPSRNDRPQRERPDTAVDNARSNNEPNTQPRVDRQPRQDQPRAAAPPPAQTAPPTQTAPVSTERARDDRPQRWQRDQRERQPQAEEQQQRRQQNEQMQRQGEDNARAARAAREQERRPEPQPAERRESPAERPRVERPERAERPERHERQRPEPRQQSEKREAKRNPDDQNK